VIEVLSAALAILSLARTRVGAGTPLLFDEEPDTAAQALGLQAGGSL